LLAAASCIQATLFEKMDERQFPPLGGHIVIRGFSGIAYLAVQPAQVKRWEASIMNPRRLAMVPALTVILAGCVVAWVARPSVATPNSRVTDAFDAIPLNVTTVLKNVRAALPAPVIKGKVDTRSSANGIVAAEFSDAGPHAVMPSDVTRSLRQGQVLQARGTVDAAAPEKEPTSQQDMSHYVYSETSPPDKPAKIALAALSDVPLGSPVQEIERAAEAFGVDVNFMKAVAKIESDFNPKQRTGSYIGLFQLSKSEFSAYGSGEILNPRDNAMAAAYKFITEAALFEAKTHMELTFANLYLIHQQGWEGAAEHLTHPQQIAWKSMCATQEGTAKGDRWCKRAIWGNTLPAVKREWTSVDHLTSSAFVTMWRERVDTLYARMSASLAARTSEAIN
jgi:hypothetical protein